MPGHDLDLVLMLLLEGRHRVVAAADVLQQALPSLQLQGLHLGVNVLITNFCDICRFFGLFISFLLVNLK
jgi:hypothetical protein